MNQVVVGAQWGDEGKAKVVDYLAEQADIIVRFQGGANAGHTVVVGKTKFIFHLLPAGMIRPDKTCVISNGTVIDPEQLLLEVQELEKQGIQVGDRLHLAENAHVVFPWHKLIDQQQEHQSGKQAIGTTGRGIGPCYSDKINRKGIRIADLLTPTVLKEKINQAGERYQKLLGESSQLDLAQIYKQYRQYGIELKPWVTDTSLYLYQAVKARKQLLFEGAQGSILDVDHGSYPFVTSSNTIAGAVCSGAGIGPTFIQRVTGVVKAYTTRVGNGVFPTEMTGPDGDELRQKGAEFGATTGRPRRCGWFDAAVVRRAVVVNGITDMAVTKLDVLDTLPEIKVCTGYKAGTKQIDYFPYNLAELDDCQPIYETMPGWQTSTANLTDYAKLPPEAKKYLERLSELVGVPISLLSLGPEREQTIEIPFTLSPA